ncbi:MAG: hypothetical protein Q9181_006745 [Wetmoreana brouardii]
MASLADLDLDTTPAMEPPNGQLPNFVNPETMQGWLVATAVVCLTVSMLSIAMRTYVKAVLFRKVQIEDSDSVQPSDALIFSGAAFIAFTGLSLGNTGQTRHLWDITIAQAGRTNMHLYIIQILYGPLMLSAKLCVLLQMQRVFRGSKRDSVFWSIQVLIWFNLLFYITVTATFSGVCSSMARISNLQLPGLCHSGNALVVTTSAIDILSDVTILILPIFAVWKLKLPINRKLIISAVFGSGLFACISSIVRLVYSIHLIHAADATWAINPVCMWAFAEYTTVVLAGAIPTLPRLIQSFSQRQSPSSYKHNRNSNGPYEHQRRLKASDYLSFTQRDGSSAEMGVISGGVGAGRKYVPLGEHPQLRVPQATTRVVREERILKSIRIETTSEPSVGREGMNLENKGLAI